MGRKRHGGYIFYTYSEPGNEPEHVHVHDKDDEFIGKFDIEHQCSMAGLDIGKKLRKALRDLGYMKEGEGND